MDTAVLILLVIAGLVAISIFTYIMDYNKLQKYIVRIEEAENEIDDALRNRYDILVQMEKVINDKLNLKQNNFEGFENNNMSNFEVDRKLTKVTDIFNKIRNDFIDELDMDSYNNLVTDLKIVEEKCDSAKTYYNKYTTELNLIIKKFPSNIVARTHNIDERLYFDNKNMKDQDIFDFKI